MSLRIFSAGLLLAALAACGVNSSPEPEGMEIECAIGSGAEFEPVCTLEQVSSDEFVIHHPDGGFRRFYRRDDEPHLLIVADGAEPINYELLSLPGMGVDGPTIWEFGVEGSRYRLSADLLAFPANE